MKDPLTYVIALNVAIFFIFTLIGYLPTQLKGSQAKMAYLSVFSAGLIIGATLVVILPEGVALLSEQLSKENSQHDKFQVIMGASLLGGFLLMAAFDQVTKYITLREEAHHHHKEAEARKGKFEDDEMRVPLIDGEKQHQNSV